ncbi:GGDEF domain-containing protein [Paraburkholderia acidisoli]|uniref:diguanylate cyclase n=1 Tax=Paraburkholderia acidisoli TaxID=2571748 RepID=A0A7Z2GRI8_9BURK|nr:GGDEF domain-containing protein [Paraburkholderia acidisoli]QGZ66646.1 diguanylate cyclase [Paraburkholderia acidisoli]
MLSPLSLFGILIVSCLTSVAILGSLHRTTVPGLVRWCAAYSLVAAASLLVLLVGLPLSREVIVVTALFTVLAVLLLVQGTREFFGMKPVRNRELAAAIIVFAELVWFTWMSPNADARVVLFSLVSAYGRIAVGTLALRYAPREGARYPYRFVGVAAYLGALIHVARIVAIAFGIAPHATLLQPTPWNTLFLGLAIVTLPCMSIGMVMLTHDQLIRRMEWLATVDELTGILMRRAFIAQANLMLLDGALARKSVSVALLDIDNFKSINDGFGHAVGDRVLRHVASVVATQLRPSDVFGRLGGEEFAIVFSDAREAEAEALTNALRLAVEQTPSSGVCCTLSAGVSRVALGEKLEDVMARADAALYMAKATGRNRVVTAPWDDMREVQGLPVQV